MQIDWFFGSQTVCKVLSSRKLRYRHFAAQVEHVEKRPFPEPTAIAIDLGLIQVDDSADLGQIIFGVDLNGFLGQF